MRPFLLALLLLAAACRPAPESPAPASHTASPYASEASRTLKALSPAEVAAYRGGEGMGLAKAAELNGYPGPRHVLDLADSLGLTPAQAAEAQAAFDAMHREAVRLGEAIVAHEQALDSLFATGTIDDTALRAAVDTIAALQGALRYTHLRAHLRLTRALSPEQVARYNRLRGYTPDAAGHAPGHASGHAAATTGADGFQEVHVEAGDAGFEPGTIELRAGVPARLVFTRTTDSHCMQQVQIPAFGIEPTDLPRDEPVAFEFTPEEGGSYTFACGMDMVKGTLVVKT